MTIGLHLRVLKTDRTEFKNTFQLTLESAKKTTNMNKLANYLKKD